MPTWVDKFMDRSHRNPPEPSLKKKVQAVIGKSAKEHMAYGEKQTKIKITPKPEKSMGQKVQEDLTGESATRRRLRKSGVE
jgi:hypothetical protein